MKVVLSVIAGPHTDRTFEFDNHDTFLVGRGSAAHFRLPEKDMHFSRSHFLVEVNPPQCRLLDLNSMNGTFVNGSRVSEIDLHDGDLIVGGETRFVVKFASDDLRSTRRQVGPRQVDTGQVNRAIVPPSSTASNTQRNVADDQPALAETSAIPVAASKSSDADAFDELVESDDLESCPTIGPYRLIREIGRGGMGAVYLACRPGDDTLLALKTIRPDLQVGARDVKMFLREAEVLHALRHPRIVEFHECGEADGRLYFLMEYVNGPNAAQYLKTRGPLSVRRVAKIGMQLLEALEYAHGHRYVHRDIKPENVLVGATNESQHVKLTDFGLARIYQSSRISGLTLHGDMGGSLAFAAPEQLTSYRDAQPAGDIYSTAATMYTLLTGRYVYDLPKRINEAILMILQQEPVSILKRRPDIPVKFAKIIHRALARDPATRFSNATAMKDALAGFVNVS